MVWIWKAASHQGPPDVASLNQSLANIAQNFRQFQALHCSLCQMGFRWLGFVGICDCHLGVQLIRLAALNGITYHTSEVASFRFT